MRQRRRRRRREREREGEEAKRKEKQEEQQKQVSKRRPGKEDLEERKRHQLLRVQGLKK